MMDSLRDILIFDRVLNIVRFMPGNLEYLTSDIDRLQDEHLSKVVELNVCHEIIEWWAECHKANSFSPFRISADSTRLNLESELLLIPLLLPDGRAEHMLLTADSEKVILRDQKAMRLRVDDLNDSTLEFAAERIMANCLQLLGARQGFLELFPLNATSNSLQVAKLPPSFSQFGGKGLLSKNSLLSILMKSDRGISSGMYFYSSLPELLPERETDMAIDGKNNHAVLLVPIQMRDQLFGYFVAMIEKGINQPERLRIGRLDNEIRLLLMQLAGVYLLGNMAGGESEIKELRDITYSFTGEAGSEEPLKPLANAASRLNPVSGVALYGLEQDSLILKETSKSLMGDLPRETETGKGMLGEAAFNLVTQKNLSKRKDTGLALYQLAIPVKSQTVLEGKATESVAAVLYCESASELLHSENVVRGLETIVNFGSLAAENYQLMQRSLQLLSDKSRQAQMLEDKGRELNEFIHTVSHDLKNPLSNIDGFADLLMDDMREGEYGSCERYINRVRANVEIVMNILNDLLELSRVGKVNHELEMINFRDLLREIVFDFQHGEKELDIVVNFESLPEYVRVNRHRITQVFNNILGNAVKYADPMRPPEAEISCRQDGEFWIIQVKDNGIGIPAEKLKEIFNFGFRVHESKSDGTGAGLAISKKIVETHGGTMWAESQKEVSSSFFFTLPSQ